MSDLPAAAAAWAEADSDWEEKKRRDSLERRASASSLALSHWAMWRVEVDDVAVGPAEDALDVVEPWPIRSRRFFRCVFQKFLISLSVLPGSCDAIVDHLFKILQQNALLEIIRKKF